MPSKPGSEHSQNYDTLRWRKHYEKDRAEYNRKRRERRNRMEEEHDITCHAPKGCDKDGDMNTMCDKCEYNTCQCVGCVTKRG